MPDPGWVIHSGMAFAHARYALFLSWGHDARFEDLVQGGIPNTVPCIAI